MLASKIMDIFDNNEVLLQKYDCTLNIIKLFWFEES